MSPAPPCPLCGGPVRITRRNPNVRGGRARRSGVSGARTIVCPRCRFRIYDYPRVCVGFVVHRGSELLILTRGHEPRRGCLDLPGGFIEAGEDLVAAARRELHEETALRVGRAKPLGTYWDRYFLRGFGRFPTLNFYFLAPWGGGRPRAGDDAAEAHWIPLQSLGRAPLSRRLAWPHMRSVFRDARRLLLR